MRSLIPIARLLDGGNQGQETLYDFPESVGGRAGFKLLLARSGVCAQHCGQLCLQIISSPISFI